ncbi:tubulin alpha-3 chain-like [Culicoides brevitarsis]|uniref:tubulin alpha-3 chain-like n=1 Tax=Culicoides brevitarsis TaxID=469753 RepID=UPI00307C8735
MAKNREVIQIHIGQSGNQIGYSCWQLYCLEHGIYPDGTLYQIDSCGEDMNAFFNVNKTGNVTPRVLFIDLEASVIDEIRLGSYRKLFSTNSMVLGQEDASSNFAKGKMTRGMDCIDCMMDRIKIMAENCNSLQGFLLFRSLGGGTGSGFGSLILEKLKEDYEKVPRLEFDVFPSPKISPVIVEPYNGTLGVYSGMDTVNCSTLLDNEALYDICGKKLGLTNINYFNLNRIIAQAVSCITSSLRFSGDMNVDLAEFQTNLVPFQRIHFPTVSYAPLLPRLTGSNYDNLSTMQITNQAFDFRNHLVKCDPKIGKYMSCCMLYRGDICGMEINKTIQEIKESRKDMFVDWSPTSFKIGINSQPPMCVPGGDLAHSNKAVCMLSNNTAIQGVWLRLLQKFDLLFSKKAFLHHFLAEGLETSYFEEARESVATLIEDYREFDREHGATSDSLLLQKDPRTQKVKPTKGKT